MHALSHSLDVPYRGACVVLGLALGRVVLGLGLVCVMRGVGTCPSDVWCWDRTWCVSCVVLGHVPRMCGVGTWPGVWRTRCWEGLPGQVVLGRGVRGDGAGPPGCWGVAPGHCLGGAA